MNPYLAKLRVLISEKRAPLGTDKTDNTHPATGFVGFVGEPDSHFSENESGNDRGTPTTDAVPERYARTMAALRERRPDLIEVERWRQCLADGERFQAQWGEQAAALGWAARDLFGLMPVPNNPHPSFSRLSRYDHIGLCWLLQGRPAVALTESTAAIQNPTGNVTTYRKHHKPALGPVGDSLDHLE